jgi:hypothetical protein
VYNAVIRAAPLQLCSKYVASDARSPLHNNKFICKSTNQIKL